MKQKVTLTLENFEGISESQGNRLVGGFSQIFSGQESPFSASEGTTNNCASGNCVAGCGTNSGCNVVAGCGKSV